MSDEKQWGVLRKKKEGRLEKKKGGSPDTKSGGQKVEAARHELVRGRVLVVRRVDGHTQLHIQ